MNIVFTKRQTRELLRNLLVIKQKNRMSQNEHPVFDIEVYVKLFD